MKLLVCGGRDYDDWDTVCDELTWLMGDHPIDLIIHGAAKGADSLAEEFAKASGIASRPFPANWKKHGRRAGPIRNQQMLDEGKPDLVVAFPGGRGTADMIARAKAAGIEVRIVE